MYIMRKYLFIVLLLWGSIVIASPIKHIVFFGDSLSDDGNLHRYLPFIPQSPPYYAGRFSNGPVWAEYVGDYLTNRYHVSYENYAVAGSTVIFRSPFLGAPPVSLSEEIDDYSILNDASNTLSVIWSGGNDYLDVRDQPIDTLTTQIVDEISNDIELLYAKGIKNYLILGLPDLSKIPLALEDALFASRLHAISVLHNQKLKNKIQQLQYQFPNIKIVYMDTFDLITDLLKHPAKYHLNLTHEKEACWAGGYTSSDSSLVKNSIMNKNVADYIIQSTSLQEAYRVSQSANSGIVPCNNPDEYAFWDKVHPTAVLHKVLSEVAKGKVREFF